MCRSFNAKQGKILQLLDVIVWLDEVFDSQMRIIVCVWAAWTLHPNLLLSSRTGADVVLDWCGFCWTLTCLSVCFCLFRASSRVSLLRGIRPRKTRTAWRTATETSSLVRISVMRLLHNTPESLLFMICCLYQINGCLLKQLDLKNTCIELLSNTLQVNSIIWKHMASNINFEMYCNMQNNNAIC